ncbi:hypothetical protein LPJ73_002825 [Coemansia sp. RSA 2703]|nr:hypothetical protein LPJ73_002825 [Coemansia sp. RSA 2703]KAJ2371806.1 hypothetical protein IW150_004423 [Coemansia sp. RSA 2607]KAJ2381133.1 hypothetical protein GGI05_006082 [Coemansia sp. RSA 2603]
MYKSSFALFAFVAAALAAGDSSPVVVAVPNAPPAVPNAAPVPVAPMAVPMPPAAVPGAGAAPAAVNPAAAKPAAGAKPADAANNMTDGAKNKDASTAGDKKPQATAPAGPAKGVKNGAPASSPAASSKAPAAKQDNKADSASGAETLSVSSFAAVVMAVAALSAFC